VLGDEGSARSGIRQTRLLLGDGTTLPVSLGQQAAAWCLVDVHVSSKAHLDYCNLNAFAAVGQVFVCYGPAGVRGMLSVNGSPLEVTVPTSGKMPLTVDHETLTIVVANEEQIDSICIGEDAALIGVSGVTPEGFPILPSGVKTYTRAGSDGIIKQVMVESRSVHSGQGAAPALVHWTSSSSREYQDGSGARFAAISGPAEMAVLGCPHGYGWYRLTISSDSAHKSKLIFPNAADRLHVYMDGEFLGTAGYGPGAEELISASFKRGERKLVLLAENLGRFCGGLNLGERKGLFGEAYEASPLKVTAPKIQRGEPIEILPFRTPAWGVSEGDTTAPDRVTWSIAHRRKTPVIVSFGSGHVPGIVILNNKPLHMLDASGPAYFTLLPDQLGKGTAQLQFASLGHGQAEQALERLAKMVRFYEGTRPLCAEADLAFAKWEAPIASAFAPVKAFKTDGPRWWKATFTPTESDAPLFFEAVGLSKGQLYVNGRHVSRYFVSCNGKKVGPLDRTFIPRAFMRPKQPNELMIFDEEGASPVKTRLVQA
jgi:hypothetical protein